MRSSQHIYSQLDFFIEDTNEGLTQSTLNQTSRELEIHIEDMMRISKCFALIQSGQGLRDSFRTNNQNTINSSERTD